MQKKKRPRGEETLIRLLGCRANNIQATNVFIRVSLLDFCSNLIEKGKIGDICICQMILYLIQRNLERERITKSEGESERERERKWDEGKDGGGGRERQREKGRGKNKEKEKERKERGSGEGWRRRESVYS